MEVQDESAFQIGPDVCGVLVQYPTTEGHVNDYKVGFDVLYPHLNVDKLIWRTNLLVAYSETMHSWDAGPCAIHA